MAQDVVVVFVHGINVDCQDYHASMRDLMTEMLPRDARQYVTFRSVFWADIVRGRQQEYLAYARTKPKSKFRDTWLHKLVIEGLGDAVAYQRAQPTSQRPQPSGASLKSYYCEIQERLTKTICDTATKNDDARPLVFIGHSLGCHIISTYVWDMRKQQIEGAGPSPLERLETFAAFITMGSNMPLFTFTLGAREVFPITHGPDRNKPGFPGSKLTKQVGKQAQWLNFYSKNDPLGYPLKPINEDYDNCERISDIHTRSEGLWRSFLMRGVLRPVLAEKAHSGYWCDRKIAKRSAKLVGNMIYADEIAIYGARMRWILSAARIRARWWQTRTDGTLPCAAHLLVRRNRRRRAIAKEKAPGPTAEALPSPSPPT
jgi:hypothetical protein